MANDTKKTLKLRCPNDGSVLVVLNQPGIERAFVKCPVCKKRMPFRRFDIIEDGAQAGPNDDAETQIATTEMVCYHRLAVLNDPSTGESYKLKKGKNIIGRKSTDSSADIQLPCGDSKRMSREHLIIQVEGNSMDGYTFYASLYKAKVNATYVGDAQVEYGDSIILNDGDVIKLPDKTIVFNVPKLE